LSVKVDDGGHWLRQNILIMARTNNTAVDFWLSLTLTQLGYWIKDSNTVTKEAENARKR